jgi:hypothetical protein
MNMSLLCREFLAVHDEVHRLMFAAMMPGLTVKEIGRLKRLEAEARAERKRLCALVRAEIRLRVDAWDNGCRYSELGNHRHGLWKAAQRPAVGNSAARGR